MARSQVSEEVKFPLAVLILDFSFFKGQGTMLATGVPVMRFSTRVVVESRCERLSPSSSKLASLADLETFTDFD